MSTGPHPPATRVELVETNGIRLSTLVAGTGPPVLLAHGFPELGHSWRHQVTALVAAGYQVVVPDMRGYGDSDRPDDEAAYGVEQVATDLAGLLDALGHERAVLVGHDWGAAAAWATAVLHPDRVRAVVGLSVPHGPPAAVPPTEVLRRRLGDDFYMIWYQEPGRAEGALSGDLRRTFTGLFAEAPGCLHARAHDAALPEWIDPDDLQVYLDAYERTGFAGGLRYYRNIDRNWELARARGHHVHQPAMFATGADDLVRRFQPADRLAESCTDLRGHHVVPQAGHWLQQQRPDEVNALLLRFLEGLD
ncbi:pimeloyl-ACP methyl ester carboxylesterase [Nocardioides sp. J9]|uniref:alpha/beta fold hydrolase n=1 Tax=Nocardioides sp. J9 TaxID=935844 RepID=UPI0011A64506|nr:alpha/beta hydrolase [Nocardioides sp. J9]TWH02680.1 pimeloyl-ACP methyl ester carboxylesterase [Nocardioides sp. J9]